jgi:hypothetical protein
MLTGSLLCWVRKDEGMSQLTIKTWLDSGANHDSTRWVEFEIEEEEWGRMTEEERDEYAKDYAWDHLDWGWVVKDDK